MSPPEKQIRAMEDEFPTHSGEAFANAQREAFDSGMDVLCAEDGVIYRIKPNGSRELVKQIAKPVAATPGQRIRIG